MVPCVEADPVLSGAEGLEGEVSVPELLALAMQGVDLTASLDQALHGADLLERVPVIGMLDED